MPDTISANEAHGVRGFYVRVACRAAQVAQALLAFLFLCAASSRAQVTSLTMISDPNDYIGAGQFYYFTPPDGNFTQQGGSTQHVSISFTTPSFSQFWYLDFAAPNGQSLVSGNYPELLAIRFRVQTNRASA